MLKAYGTSDTNEEVGLFYGVERVPRGASLPTVIAPSLGLPERAAGRAKARECEPPSDHWCHVCSRIQLRPGGTILFSVPREALCENLMLYVVYNYSFEADERGWVSAREPQHRVYFNAWCELNGSTSPRDRQRPMQVGRLHPPATRLAENLVYGVEGRRVTALLPHVSAQPSPHRASGFHRTSAFRTRQILLVQGVPFLPRHYS